MAEMKKLRLLANRGALQGNKVNIVVKTANLRMKCKFHYFFPASHDKNAFKSCLPLSTPAPTKINKQNISGFEHPMLT